MNMIVGNELKLTQTILNFGSKLAQVQNFLSKTGKVNMAIEFCIFELVWVPNLSLN